MSDFAISAGLIRRLSAGRWIIPVLALMAEHGGSRFSVIERRLAVSKSVLSRTLSALEGQGWVARNPGHGHPLRPEYLLTASGRGVAHWCAALMQQRRVLGLEGDGFARWSLPLVGAIGDAWTRFSALQRALAPITARALSLELDSLRSADLVARRAPDPLYGLTPRGLHLAELLVGS